jgi:hypothetical protein
MWQATKALCKTFTIANSVLDMVVPWGQYNSNYIIFRNVENFKYIYIIFLFFQNIFFSEGKERIFMEYLRIYYFVEMKYILKMK